ncbi:hypothetical protein NIA71_01110 [Ihubacter massiliensis]|uniref:Uncharacterized protein n=1 Tax=Hominibacterium faecale TaxID=2839743 RepID=A0A9J6QZ56_9FIRM|nr:MULTISPECIES: hypothetical protein [Eubacteriales Family XIII. Incertae Sedis]MCC2864874.1 hypothetical protein [Anaerovorax odorimutans]MCI7301471.1 hypothetical protein [Clostridia bacterium]MDY3010640.1 hypothetical protein [Clostridiales Family XIII bacterium]MCO7120553.1 hypothetical protein [Ihubacter massiliensis]MCU7380760.1 hypothetical protein [Hominibacterium faecale]
MERIRIKKHLLCRCFLMMLIVVSLSEGIYMIISIKHSAAEGYRSSAGDAYKQVH